MGTMLQYQHCRKYPTFTLLMQFS
uniref:Uncharacterized protein n=1 Tax=Anguilla anguilla TaxID=7936 RepID=A0A0E9XCW2_ANGAN